MERKFIKKVGDDSYESKYKCSHCSKTNCDVFHHKCGCAFHNDCVDTTKWNERGCEDCLLKWLENVADNIPDPISYQEDSDFNNDVEYHLCICNPTKQFLSDCTHFRSYQSTIKIQQGDIDYSEDEDENKESTCVICDKIKDGVQIVIHNKCKCIYHMSCIEKFEEIGMNNCPLCDPDMCPVCINCSY